MQTWFCLLALGQPLLSSISQWIQWSRLQTRIMVSFFMHCQDYFHILHPSFSCICQHNLDRSIDSFCKLSNLLHPDKLEGPSTCLTILGVEIYSVNLQAEFWLCQKCGHTKCGDTSALVNGRNWSYSKVTFKMRKVVPQGCFFLYSIINFKVPPFQETPHLSMKNSTLDSLMKGRLAIAPVGKSLG